MVQFRASGEIERNLDKATRLLRAARAEGAEFIALPENYAHFSLPGSKPAPIDSLRGAITSRMADLAGELGCYLLLGGQPERAPEETRYYNTSLVVSPGGQILGHYRKRHMFEARLPDGTTLNEATTMLAGSEIVTVPTPLAVFGLSICFDLRFPEHFRALGAQGAEVLTAPSAFTRATGSAHWHILCRARAIENQCFLLAPNQAGRHGGKRESYGHSLIVDPWGEILAEVRREEGIAVARLEARKLAEVRQRMAVRPLPIKPRIYKEEP